MSRATLLPPFALVVGLSCVLSGCDAGAVQANAMKRFGLVYHSFIDEYQAGPENWDELLEFAKRSMPDDVSSLEGLRSANYVVAWGRYKFSDVIVGTSRFVLLYPPAAAEQGGDVLMMDGGLKHLSAGVIAAYLKDQQSTTPTGVKKAD
jgi:hypothetical protein